MPVCSASRCCICSRYCRPLCSISRRWSSSWSTPSAMVFGLPCTAGGLGAMVRLIRSATASQQSSCSPSRCMKDLFSVCRQASLMMPIAFSARLSARHSRGLMRPVDTLPAMRSRSCMVLICSRSRSRISGWRNSCSTTLCRLRIALTSLRGSESQRLSRRAPIGLTVWSSISSREQESALPEGKSSRLVTVKVSSHTYRSSSSRLSARI